MELFNLILIIAALLYFGVTIYLANYEQAAGGRATLVRLLLYGVLGVVLLNALATLQLALVPLPAEIDVPVTEIDRTGALMNFVIALVVCLFALRVISAPSMREGVKRILGTGTRYDPNSIVHTTAIVLCLSVVSFTIGQVVTVGGVSGLAESLETTGVSVGDAVFNQVLWIIVAFLGIGLFLRRTPQQAFERLGLRVPTGSDIRAGLLTGLVLFGFAIIVSNLWAALVAPEIFQEQTAASEQIAMAFNTLPLALLLAIFSSVGEETLFRGALQPVFGLWITSIFFTVLHTQYTLTPASLMILVVALVCGWIRKRYSTTASIIGHFTYNFVLLAVPILLGSLVGG